MLLVSLKRLSATELPWLGGHGGERMRDRGPRLEDHIVERLLEEHRGGPTQVRLRWHDGHRVVEELRAVQRRGKSWWLCGEPLHGERLRRLRAGDVVVLTAETIPDVAGGNRWLLTLDGWIGREREDDEAQDAVRLALRDGVSTTLEGDAAEEVIIAAKRLLPAFGGGASWEVDTLGDQEWGAVRAWLTKHVRLPVLRDLLVYQAGEDVEVILEMLGRDGGRPTRRQLAEAVIRRYGADLLAHVRRREILIGERFRKHRRRPPNPETWSRGSSASRRLARQLGLPVVMAGQPMPSTPDFEDLPAFPDLGQLHDYQRQIADGMRNTLHAPDARNRRAVVWLPTGTGKTRVCVETLLMETFLAPPRTCILWVADREELCEQAIETFRHVWMVRGHLSPSARGVTARTLRVVRLWGGREWQELPAFPALLVASIQTLGRRAADPEFARRLAELGERCAAVVFDEAHHVVAPTYARVIRALGLTDQPNALGNQMRTGAPLFGLTATPGRRSRDETERLVRRFDGRLLEPDERYRSIRGFIRSGYLAKPRLEVVTTGYVLDVMAEESELWAKYREIPRGTLRRAGEHAGRTAAILKDLEPRLPDLRSVLIFACSVQHAETMAEVLSRRGHRAVALHGGSPRALRQSAIRRFRERALKILVSCDLLTTGFDAPNVDCVVLARPVESRVLFAQMVGRGLRGPKNGGTERCLVLDYEDTIGPYATLDQLRGAFRTAFLESAQAEHLAAE